MNNIFKKLEEKIQNLQVEEINEKSFIISGIYNEKVFKSSVFLTDKRELKLNINGDSFLFSKNKVKKASDNSDNTDIEAQSIVKSPITGTVKEILVSSDQKVCKNDLLVKIESMKMILNVVSQKDGFIKEIKIKQGDKVSFDDYLLEVV